ncbi:RNA-guided endonuclease InsQ/TnpB family protein [Meiothermus granaticius]|uniref:Transposase, IS605 OrfB family n=1 Tax=Meiothermus granaticius NBRC 107808 TaxID=1227551 RepID=A0A399F6B7_9DEIN|nr:RNA-guided endonuclease TnpB family protein [Meiothermus granaticius]RIH91166.1 transposase, IS605 OrfB family [Meiothermus granaticius NBRC 107808]GEM88366.1 transposase [Meiothermus granaticius NBRC 107808]
MAVYRKVYRFRIEPTQAQSEALLGMAGARRFVWNWGLARRKEVYAATGKGLTYNQQAAELTALKKQLETAWLKDVDSQLLQQALKDLDRAYQAFFSKQAGFPRFKSKKRDAPRFRIPQRVRVKESEVYIPKVGWIRIRQSQPVDCSIKGATFKRDAEGQWYVSLTAEFEMPDVPLPPANPERVVGIDLGLKDFAVMSDGTRIAPPKFYRRGLSKLRRVQRQLSRKQKGSKNRDKARKRLSRVHAKVRNQRQDFLHKLTTGLVQKYDGLCIEDLNLRGMAKTKLSKSVLDAALGEFRRQLEYKTIWHCKHLAVIDRYFPSSRLCRECGSINANLTLSDRVWICECGAVHDRDLNAACNIKAEGMRHIPLVYGPSPSREGIVPVAAGHTETQNAWGEGVRPAHSRQSSLNQESHVL